MQRDLGDHLTLGLEAFRNTAMAKGSQASTGFDVGGQVNIGEEHHVLFSAGRHINGESQSYFYVGYQFTVGTFGTLHEWFHRGHSRP